LADAGHPVEALLRRAVAAGRFPGAVAMWGRGSEAHGVALWGASVLRPDRTPASADTWFDLASLTKPLVIGTLVLLAVRDGALRLHDTVGEVLSEASNRPLGSVTLAQLLGHAAGLPAWLPLYGLSADPKSVQAKVLELEPGWEPGIRVEYSCVGYILLGWILERAFDCRLDEAFRREVLQPLGLETELGYLPDPRRVKLAGSALDVEAERRLCAELGFDPEAFPPMAPGLPEDGNARFLGGVSGNAGLFGTARGVFRLACEYLRGSSRLLDDNEIGLAQSPLAAGPEQVRSIGWQLASTVGCSAGPALSNEAFGHAGHTGTSVWIDPLKRAVAVLLANRNHPGFREVELHPVRRRFHSLAFGDLELREEGLGIRG